MELSFEIPFPEINTFKHLEDFPFLLAQHASKYPDLYGRDLIRGAILDNGMYELDQPLPEQDLVDAVLHLFPRVVIAPDWMDEKTKTIEAALRLQDTFMRSKSWSGDVGAVVQGKDLNERVDCFQKFQKHGFRPICFPFRTPRNITIGALDMMHLLKGTEWYHLLGLQRLSELGWDWTGRWSVDTGKPFKGYYLNRASDIRGHGRLDLNSALTLLNKETALWNVAYMRKLATH